MRRIELNCRIAKKTMAVAVAAIFSTASASVSATDVASDTQVTGDIAGLINFTADVTYRINGSGMSPATLTGAVTTGTDNTGTLHLSAMNASVTGNVGTSGVALKSVIVEGPSTLQGNLYASHAHLDRTSMVINGTAGIGAGGITFHPLLASGASGTNTLTFGGNATVIGNINTTPRASCATYYDDACSGGAFSLAPAATSDQVLSIVNINGNGSTVDLQGDVHATTINFGHANGATLRLDPSKSIVADVTTSYDNKGNLEFTAAGTMNGQIGTAAKKLQRVQIDGNVTANEHIYSSKTTFHTSDVTLTVADGKNISGDVVNALYDANGIGTLNLLGSTAIGGAVGWSPDFAPDAGPLKEIRAGAGNVMIDGIQMGYDAPEPGTASPTSANLVTINGANTVTFNTGLVGNTLAFGANNGTVVIGAGYNLASAVTNNAGVGTVTFAGSTTTQANIGASGTKLAAINFNGGTVNIDHDLAANTISFNGSSAITFTGNRTLTVAPVADSGLVQVLGTASIDVRRTTLTIVGPFDLNSGTTLKTELYDTGAGNAVGRIVANDNTGGAFVHGNAKLDVNVTTTRTVNDGQKFLLIDSKDTDGNVVNAITTVTDNSAVLNFSTVSCTDGSSTVCVSSGGAAGNDLYLVASRVSGGYVGSAGVTTSAAAPAGNVLDAIAQSGAATGDMATVINALNSYDAPTLRAALEKAAPIANASTAAPAISVAFAAVGLTEARLAGLRGDTSLAAAGETGLAAGDEARNKAFWLKGFGSWGRQGMKDGFDGYKNNTSGLALGADTLLPSEWTVGLGFSYANTKVDQKDARVGDWSKIRSGQLTAYAGREFGAAYFDAMLAYTDLRFNTSRATALSRTATGSFGGHQWTTKLGGGYRIAMGGGTTFTPMASLQYSSLKQKAYTEDGAGALNLAYAASSTARTQSSVGARLANEGRVGSGASVRIEGRLAWLHDFRDAGTDTTSSYTGGGAAFTTNGQKIAKNGYNLGLGATYEYGKGTGVALQYDHEGRSGYSSDAVQVVGRWVF